MLARNLSAAPASLLWSKSDQLKIYIRFYHTGLSREKSMKVIFYVAATCGNIDFHFMANLEHQFVITRSLTTLFWSLYLLHMEREREMAKQWSETRDLLLTHSASGEGLKSSVTSASVCKWEMLSLHFYIAERLQNIIYWFIMECVCVFICNLFSISFFVLLNDINLEDCSIEHIEPIFDI